MEKLTKKDYEQAVREDKWLDDVLDGMSYKAPKKTVQDWRLITKDELLKKYGRGTMWVFVPQAVTHKGTFQEMRVKKINLSYAGNGFTYKHEADVMDLGEMHKDTTRGMWDELVASGEYIEYNEHPIPQGKSDWDHRKDPVMGPWHEKKRQEEKNYYYENYALEA